ncbi:ankyrin repeat domain-containing protein [Sutterella faecalis]|uniref:Ankyrin repeat domain-containing protein n=2 Tax=Sutterella TaxID=40544 RepID=A0AAI9SBH9_9BURK|nr:MULTISPECIES: ankyrin repeat domain-containing protein [Sutterella]KAB7650077.1 ankyrin repeat domain-containing protein [Sutterella seckii]QDA55453.1 ankyrin repeat domain-containing protein [Sutterella faecalis]
MRIRPLLAGASVAFALFATALSFPLSAAPQEENALTSAQLAEIRQAVRAGQASVVEDLLKNGASPNFRMENGDTGFTYAVRADTPQVAEALLKSGKLALNDANRFGETPLMMAVFKGNNELFDELLKAGADPKGGANWTALHYAATEGRTEMIEKLLALGVSPNVQTSSGVTPLIMAARKPSRASVMALLKAGAYRDYCTDKRESPADFARRAGDQELAKYLAVEACAVVGKKK